MRLSLTPLESRPFGGLLMRQRLKSGLSEDDAADAVQNVFTITLRRLESLRDTERFSAWLITTSHRECWRIARWQLVHAT